MKALTELSLSRTNIMELEDRDLSLCPNLISLNLRN
jgi:Leucine-rich repeat (LRR) protein